MKTRKEKLDKTAESNKKPGTKREYKSEGGEFSNKKSDSKDSQSSPEKEVDFDKIKGNKK